MKKIRTMWKCSTFYTLFNFGNDMAKGRCSMLSSSILTNIITYFTGGIFYTSFLLSNDINIVNIGIISFIPYIASIFGIFSPMILERFPKRKLLLATMRLIYYTINILGLTMMPLFVRDASAKVIWFIVIMFVSNSINSLFSAGYTAWNVNFIPNQVRADYFPINMFLSSFMSGIVLLITSQIADSLKGSEYQLLIIEILRYAAYIIAIGDVIVLSLPKEFPYEHSHTRQKLLDVFVMPVRNRKFVLTMVIMFVFTVIEQLTSAVLPTYLLKDIGVSYLFYNFIIAAYSLFFVLFSKFWKKKIIKYSWFKIFAITELLHVPTIILFAFISPGNYIWLMLTVRLTQHFLGVGRNVTVANMPYINLPDEDRTNYVSFYNLIFNGAIFMGMMFGTAFVAAVGSGKLHLFNFSFGSVQILMLIQVIGYIIITLLVIKLLPKVQPAN